MKRLLMPVLAAAMVFGLAGCEREGPMERAGEELDEFGRDTRDRAGDAADDIRDQTRDMTEEPREETPPAPQNQY